MRIYRQGGKVCAAAVMIYAVIAGALLILVCPGTASAADMPDIGKNSDYNGNYGFEAGLYEDNIIKISSETEEGGEYTLSISLLAEMDMEEEDDWNLEGMNPQMDGGMPEEGNSGMAMGEQPDGGGIQADGQIGNGMNDTAPGITGEMTDPNDSPETDAETFQELTPGNADEEEEEVEEESAIESFDFGSADTSDTDLSSVDSALESFSSNGITVETDGEETNYISSEESESTLECAVLFCGSVILLVAGIVFARFYRGKRRV